MIGTTEIIIIAIGAGLLIVAPSLVKSGAKNFGEALSEFRDGLGSKKKDDSEKDDKDNEETPDEIEDLEVDYEPTSEEDSQQESNSDEIKSDDKHMLEAPKRRVVKKVTKNKQSTNVVELPKKEDDDILDLEEIDREG